MKCCLVLHIGFWIDFVLSCCLFPLLALLLVKLVVTKEVPICCSQVFLSLFGSSLDYVGLCNDEETRKQGNRTLATKFLLILRQLIKNEIVSLLRQASNDLLTRLKHIFGQFDFLTNL